jgi:Spy/CpxP family protein refolding chaperone
MEEFMKALFLTLAASTLLVVPAAFSQTHPSTEQQHQPNTAARHEETMVERHVNRLAVMFNLTPGQKKEATTYFSDDWKATQPVWMQMREDRKTLDKDIEAKADQSKLTADATAIGHDQSTIVANNAVAREKFFSLLSPAEQAKYEKLQATRFGGFNFGPGPSHRARQS